MQVVQACFHGIHHLVQIGEYQIAHLVLADVFPHMLGWVQFGTVGRQGDQSHAGGDDEIVRLVPSGAIQEHDAVLVWELGGCLRQEQGHQPGVNPGQDQRGHLAVLGTHGHIGIDVFADDLAANGRPEWEGRPATPAVADPTEPAFVLE